MKFKDMPYERVDFTKVQEDFSRLMQDFDAAKSGEEQWEVHKRFYELVDQIETMLTLSHIRHSIDTTDAFYDAENDYYDQTMPLYQNLLQQYQKKLYASPYRAYLMEKIGPVAFKNIEISQKAFDESLILLMQEENALTSEYNKLIAAARIEFDGQVQNLSLMSVYLTHRDRYVRQQAWEKVNDYFLTVEPKIDEIYDKLVKNRTAQAHLMGYADFRELGYYRMQRNDYGEEQVAAFREQVKRDFVPFAECIHEKRRQHLGTEHLSGIDNDVWFAEGNPTPIGTPEEILSAGQKMYSELSPETKEFMDFMTENELFDVLGRKNKQAGGYMTYLPKYGAPFVFANFNGTNKDVETITHECGHAFQGYLAGKDPIREHADITMETAEIHSMSMEFFTERWMELFFGDGAENYRQMHLGGAITFIPYGCMVDEFQHIIYANPDLTPQERKDVWHRLEGEYKPHMDFSGLDFFERGGYWMRQQHIFNSPFYYIDYVLAQSCALSFKVKMDADFDGAWADYLKLCELSATDFFTGLLKTVGLDNPFEEGYMKKLIGQLSYIFA